MTYGERITVYPSRSLVPLRWRYAPHATPPTPRAGEFWFRSFASNTLSDVRTVPALRAAADYLQMVVSITSWDGYDVRQHLAQGPGDPPDFAPLRGAAVTLRGPGPILPDAGPLLQVDFDLGEGPYDLGGRQFVPTPSVNPTWYNGRATGWTVTGNPASPELEGLTVRFEGGQYPGREYWAQDVGGDVRWDYERVFSDPIETASLKLRWTDAIAPGDFLQWRGQLYRIDLVETEGRRRSMTLACSRLAE